MKLGRRYYIWQVFEQEHGDDIAAAAAKSLQSCQTLWDPRDGSPPGSPIPGILQARTLEWVAISFSNAWKWKGKVKLTLEWDKKRRCLSDIWEIMDDLWFHEGNLEKRFQEPEQGNGSEAVEEGTHCGGCQ